MCTTYPVGMSSNPSPATQVSSGPLERSFLPRELQITDWSDVSSYIDALQDRAIDTCETLAAWLRDVDEVLAVVGEVGSRAQIAHACHTDDAEIEQRFNHWVEKVRPELQRAVFALQKKFVASPACEALDGMDMDILRRSWRNDVELFREENVALQTQVTQETSAYNKTIGSMTVSYDGQTRTLQQMGKYLESPDRSVREATWRLTASRRLEEVEKLTEIFSRSFDLRQKIAQQADCVDYRAYAWKQKERFDYTPDDCLAMHEAIEAVVLPKVAELDRRRQSQLGVETLRPWDLGVDPAGRPPLKPFAEDDVTPLRDGVSAMLRAVEPGLGDDFDLMEDGRNLDLISRQGKRAGGFQSSLSEVREPFIFMNAAGLQRDVETLLHEAGHAFHYQWASRAQPFGLMHHSPLEFAEVASMSMELLTLPEYGRFYEGDDASADRARRAQLEGIIRFYPWMATIDAFQHEIYTRPGLSAEARNEAWLAMRRRFGSPVVDWSGLEREERAFWQRQIHLFAYPFYYIEYGIAQLGALQLWQRYLSAPGEAMADYRTALSYGGSRRLPDLFAAAGLSWGFGREQLEPAIETLWEALEKLDA